MSTNHVDVEQVTDIHDPSLAAEAIQQVRAWLVAARDEPTDTAAQRLAGLLRDSDGLAFAVGFVDGVVRPEDVRIAARNLRALVPLTPRFLPWSLRSLIRLGGAVAPIMPSIVVPAARRALRTMVRHLVVDARQRPLGRAIRRIRGSAPGAVRLNVNLLGEAILGEKEAARRLEGTRRLLSRADVDYVSIKVSSTVAPHSPWAFDEAVAHAVEALRPLYSLAAAAPAGPKFINLDMEEYRDLDLTLAVFTSILDRPEFTNLEAGIVLQAYLPDALGAMIRLQTWAAARVAAGGAPIKVRVVKGANLPMEQVDADVHGWPLATWETKQESDASYKAVLDYALHPDRVVAVRVGIAGHNLFDIALAWTLARRRGVVEGVDFEMLLGMASAQVAAVRRDVGSVLLYTPVVHPAEFDVAIAYLIRRLEEGASTENFMSAVFDLDQNESLFERERDRFAASLASVPTAVPKPKRVQNRSLPAEPASRDRFDNQPDTDPSVAMNRAWAAAVRQRMQTTSLGLATVVDNTVSEACILDSVVSSAVAAGEAWRELGALARAEILHRAGDLLEERRAELLEIMGSEAGKVIEQGDAEVSEAVDFAHYYARLGLELDAVEGARFEPPKLSVVTPPWNFPVAIPAGSTLAALAAGSPVIIKPARQARRSGAVMVEALWDAGVPRDLLRYVQLDRSDLGQRLIAHPDVERVILTGGYETAELFRSFRPDLPMLAETSGKNAIIVTPSADLDLAAKDVVSSAFGHAGQKCSAASLVILVGSVARSERFRRQLVDAVSAYGIGMPWEDSARIGPLIGPAEGKLHRALTTLEPGEAWLLAPERLSEDGSLWSPGIRAGIQAESDFHLTEYFGPVLGIMTADTLDDATDLVNRIDYGLTSGLHSLDEAEIARWLERVEAGNLYVNRGTTGAIVQRQPFGGWKRSAVGPGGKAGGPNYLVGLGRWKDLPVAPDRKDTSDALTARVMEAARGAGATDAELVWIAGALHTDRAVWEQEFGVAKDVTELQFEQNVFRYCPVPAIVRVEDASPAQLLRVVAAAVRSGAPIAVSTAAALAPAVTAVLDQVRVSVDVEGRREWGERLCSLPPTGARIRVLGGSAMEVAELSGGVPSLAVYDGEVVSAGRVEMLTFLREQSISLTAHRFGSPRRYDVPARRNG